MKRKKVGPTVGPSFQTEMEGVTLMRVIIPSNWLIRDQSPDFFVDYMIETVVGGEVTGAPFGVQLKSTNKKSKAASPSYNFSAKHLHYYLRCAHPIFLFLAHLPSKEIKWVFAQEYILKYIGNTTLEESKPNKKFSIKFNPNDDLRNIEKFKISLEIAHKFIRDLRPGSIKSAIQWRKKELELKDPRIKVDINVINGVEQINIQADKDLPLKFSDPDKALRQGIRQHIESGEKIHIHSENIKVYGLPLLDDKVSKLSHIIIGPADYHEVDLELLMLAGQVVKIQAKGWRGSKYMTFEGSIPDSPISLRIIFPTTSSELKNLDKHSDFQFLIDPWIGEQILFLPYFDDVASIVSAASVTGNLDVSVKSKGNALCKGIITLNQPDEIKRCESIIDFLVASRLIAAKSGVNPILPKLEDISISQANTVFHLFNILKYGKFTRKGMGAKITCTLVDVDPKLLKDNKKHSFSVITEVETFDFFGTEIFIGPLKWSFTNMEIKSFSQLSDKQTKIVFVAATDSELTESVIEEPETTCSTSWPVQ